ncbi:hypothetical protein B484DRAFT_461544 [Ochromonadaceae sp. CCMP2298]|nr:hypothetical protein B484DRAFT_461544 [Ochromonadaceae sp. CCMP2298]
MRRILGIIRVIISAAEDVTNLSTPPKKRVQYKKTSMRSPADLISPEKTKEKKKAKKTTGPASSVATTATATGTEATSAHAAATPPVAMGMRKGTPSASAKATKKNKPEDLRLHCFQCVGEKLQLHWNKDLEQWKYFCPNCAPMGKSWPDGLKKRCHASYDLVLQDQTTYPQGVW